MLVEFESAIVERLKAKVIANVQGWSGRADELFQKPKTYPAIRVIIERLVFDELQSPYAYVSTIEGSAIVFFASTKDKGQGAYPLIEGVINALSGFIAVGYDLRVKKVELLFHEGIDFAYQVQFEALGRYVVPYEEAEPLVKRITTYEGGETTEVWK